MKAAFAGPDMASSSRRPAFSMTTAISWEPTRWLLEALVKGPYTMAVRPMCGGQRSRGSVDLLGSRLGRLRLPLRFAYTLTEGQFLQDFHSDFQPWDTVQAGDHIPYLARHQLFAGLSLEGLPVASPSGLQPGQPDAHEGGARGAISRPAQYRRPT